MTRYAQTTNVPSERSRVEIERTLSRYGATAFGYMSSHTEAVVMFEIAKRRVLFRIPMPDRRSREFTHTPAKGLMRSVEAADEAYELGIRQRWRALSLVIKAKLEAVDAGITTVEQEFLAHIVLPDGTTVGEWARPQLAAAYERGEMPALLPGASR